MMRWILITLLTLNVCYFLWQWLQDDDGSPRYPELPAAPTVELLEQEAALPEEETGETGEDAAGQRQVRDQSAAVDLASRCARVGPFSDQQARRRFRQALGNDLPMTPQRGERVDETRYRVYLPPFESRQAAAEANTDLRQALEGEGLDIESFVITAGELADGISLGVFREQGNAAALQRQLSDLDHPVRVREEQSTETVYWLVVKGGAAVVELNQRWAVLSAEYDTLQVTENLCESFAPSTDFP